MDDTLYPLSTGINLACRKNIQGEFRIQTYPIILFMIYLSLYANFEVLLLKFYHIDKPLRHIKFIS